MYHIVAPILFNHDSYIRIYFAACNISLSQTVEMEKYTHLSVPDCTSHLLMKMLPMWAIMELHSMRSLVGNERKMMMQMWAVLLDVAG